MAFLAELKKRHVFKVGAAYSIVAWLLVQAADVFVPALHLPDWTITLVAGLVLAGFPVALILAWAFEITPDGVLSNDQAHATPGAAGPMQSGHRLNTLTMALVVLAVVFLMVDRFVLVPEATSPPGGPGATVQSAPVIAAVVPLPDSAPLGVGTADIGFDSPSIAISPDSRWLVYVSSQNGQSNLVRYRLDEFGEPENIPGTEGAIFAFFSPDGAYIGFLTNERIKRVPVAGDDVKTIASSRSPVRAQWLTSERIFFIDNQGASLRVVDVESGAVDDILVSMPIIISGVLPGGDWALGAQRIRSISGDYAQLVRVNIATGDIGQLGAAGFDPRLLPHGHLVFGRNGDVYSASFDAASATLTGEPQVVLEDVAMDSSFHQIHLTHSDTGTLLYVPGNDRAIGQIVAVDDSGNERLLPPSPQRYGVLDLDSNDRQLAVQVGDIADYVQVYDLEQNRGRKLPGSTGFGWPKFGPDGSIALTENSSESIDTRIRIIPAGNEEPYFIYKSNETDAVVADWSPDGSLLSLSEWVSAGVILLPVTPTEPQKLIDTSSAEWGAVFSPDGEWIAISSDMSGRFEVWIRSLQDDNVLEQATVNGGIESVWCPCGEVFYRRGDEFWAVAVQTEPELRFGQERLAFTVTDFLDTPGRSYDVSSDGKTLYTIKRAEPAIVDRIHVLSNWLDSLPAHDAVPQ